MTTDPYATLKQQAAERAVEFIESGMVIGLGVGSTAIFALQRVAHLLQTGALKDIRGVPCAVRVAEEARRLGVPLTSLEDHPRIDLTIDGADEVDNALNLIKGAGGALLREKIVAQASRREVIIIDETKLSSVLGTRRALPIEVVPFGWRTQVRYLEALGAQVTLRGGVSAPFQTDQGNYILDSQFGPIIDLVALAGLLDRRGGIVGHGLFLGLATDVIVASEEGLKHLKTS